MVPDNPSPTDVTHLLAAKASFPFDAAHTLLQPISLRVNATRSATYVTSTPSTNITTAPSTDVTTASQADVTTQRTALTSDAPQHHQVRHCC